jgi:uncharacterized protein (DUF362 family)
MDRREFLKQVSLWSAGMLLTEPVFRITPELFADVSPNPALSVIKGKDYTSLVRTAVESLGGMSQFVKKGDRVVVKPNIGWDRNPAQAANTHPEVVKAVVQLALDAGAKEVLVFDRTCNEERRCYENSGIKPTLDSMKSGQVSCDFVDMKRFVPVNIDKGKSIKKWGLYKDAIDADCYINVPVAKNHALAILTMGLKNVMGVMGGNRGEIHRKLGDSIADLNTVIRPKLTIIDATRILLKNGPQGGDLKDVRVLDTVIASSDTVAADAYATTLFNIKPEEIPSTVAAHELGLGQMNLSKVNIIEKKI